MRLISQDGKMNFPYEYTVVNRDENVILAFTVWSPFHMVIAKYSTETLARKAMRELNRLNENAVAWHRMPEEEEICAD